MPAQDEWQSEQAVTLAKAMYGQTAEDKETEARIAAELTTLKHESGLMGVWRDVALPGFRLFLFDVDGTLVRPKSRSEFRKTADDWELLPGRQETVRHLLADGKRVALVSNQGGVAFGYLSEPDTYVALSHLASALEIPASATYPRFYVCFDHPRGTIPRFACESFRRKPNPGMLLQAMLDHEVGPTDTLMVGDRPEDEEAARNAGCAYMEAEMFFGAAPVASQAERREA